jgi:hypothetical protein
MSTIQFSHVTTDSGEQVVTAFIPGRGLLPASDSHPNFSSILATCQDALNGLPVDLDAFADLFDVAATITRKFQQLSVRVSVSEQGEILLDGDPVDGSLQDHILRMVDAGEDFGPLVNFYEKLTTNPLGNVQAGLYDWIKGQSGEGTLTITPDGDVIGYKACNVATPEWREGTDPVYVPSRRSLNGDRVNGVEVPNGSYIEQRPGDVVEMPRSKVLNAPSVACGDGLHIGTYEYASTFLGADAPVLLVKFNPRDIVSLPDRNSTWKVRVCRYTVIGEADGPLDTPLFVDEAGEDAISESPSVDVAFERAQGGKFKAGVGRPGSKRGSNGRFVG